MKMAVEWLRSERTANTAVEAGLAQVRAQLIKVQGELSREKDTTYGAVKMVSVTSWELKNPTSSTSISEDESVDRLAEAYV